jgi:hypothetical protein
MCFNKLINLPKHYKHILTIGLILLLTSILSACTLFSNSNTNLEATVVSMSLQATALAQQATAEAQNIQATVLSGQVTQLAQMMQPTSPPVEPPVIIETQIPEETSTKQTAPVPDEEMETKIRAAKILLFEDISGNRLDLLRYVKEALDNGGYAYTDVGSAQGWLKDQLIGEKEWDLIIIAAEMSGQISGRGRISGEYFDYVNPYIENGTAVIFELPSLDSIFQGNIRTILDKCGIEFEKNWVSPPSNSIWYFIQEHPVFHQPNEMSPSLRDYQRIWQDSGDLVIIKKQARTWT